MSPSSNPSMRSWPESPSSTSRRAPSPTHSSSPSSGGRNATIEERCLRGSAGGPATCRSGNGAGQLDPKRLVPVSEPPVPGVPRGRPCRAALGGSLDGLCGPEACEGDRLLRIRLGFCLAAGDEVLLGALDPEIQVLA